MHDFPLMNKYPRTESLVSMALQVGMRSCNLASPSVFSWSLPFTKPQELCLAPTKLNIGLIIDASSGTHLIRKGILPICRKISALARVKSDRVDGGGVKKKNPHLEEQRNASQLKKRLVSGLVIAISGGGVILMGGWVFTAAVSAAAFIAAQEYFELVKGVGIAARVTLPQYVLGVCSFLCALMPIWTL